MAVHLWQCRGEWAVVGKVGGSSVCEVTLSWQQGAEPLSHQPST